jgi:hypothetical protein
MIEDVNSLLSPYSFVACRPKYQRVRMFFTSCDLAHMESLNRGQQRHALTFAAAFCSKDEVNSREHSRSG